MKDELWAFDWQVWLGIALAALLLLALVGCASAQVEPPVRLAWTDERGVARDVIVEVRRAAFPPAACVALAAEVSGLLAALLVAAETHLACTSLRSDGLRAVVVLPYNAPGWLVRHELARIIDDDRSRMKLWTDLWRSQHEQTSATRGSVEGISATVVEGGH